MVVVADAVYRTYTYSFYLNQDNERKLVAEIRTRELQECTIQDTVYKIKLNSGH